MSGSYDKTIKLWNVETDWDLWDLDALMGRSCDWVRVYLGFAEKVKNKNSQKSARI